jgi:hypothetical protein
VQGTNTINELLKAGGKRIADLRKKAEARSVALEHVCAALPPAMANTVVSAGLEGRVLTIGVAGAAWAARLRYVTETLRMRVGTSMGVEIQSIRIRVVPPRP